MNNDRVTAGAWIDGLISRLEQASAELGPAAEDLLERWRACRKDLDQPAAGEHGVLQRPCANWARHRRLVRRTQLHLHRTQ